MAFEALTTLTGIAGWWSAVTGSVVWTVLSYPLNPEWVGTRIVFTLRPGPAGGTVLEFCRHGLTTGLECYGHCSRGWDYFLPSLSCPVCAPTSRPAREPR